MLGGPEGWSGRFGEDKNFLFLSSGIEPRMLVRPTRKNVTIPTTLSRLMFYEQYLNSLMGRYGRYYERSLSVGW
jgi:hypothetical protein